MRNPSVVLQDVVVLDVLRNCNLLGYGEHFVELVVGDVVQLCTVEFGDDELGDRQLNVLQSQLLFCTREGGGCAYRVPSTQRTNVQERERLLALEDLHRGDFSWSYC
jgi:hypothetical protein